jgi:hypothetical protein
MKEPLRTTLLASTLLTGLLSCSQPVSDTPATTQSTGHTNPLIGTWKFDFTSAVVYNAVYAANANLSESQKAQSKKYIELMDDSTVTFTDDTITTKSSAGTQSMKYILKSSDDNGNVVIVDQSGTPANYTVSGKTLSNSVPEYNFVAVYKKP